MSVVHDIFLCSCLRFDDIRSRTERFQSNRATTICDVYEMFNHNCAKVLVPDKFLSLDESFYPTRVGVAFRQYSKSKPTKYALPFRSLNSAKMSLTYNSVIYAGKPIVEPGPHCIIGTKEIVQSLVNFLKNHVNLQGRNISCDCFYTSILLANWYL